MLQQSWIGGCNLYHIDLLSWLEVESLVDDKLQDESGRLAALMRYDVLDTPSEPAIDRITDLVRMAIGVPMAAVSLIDTDRQTFKSVSGMGRDPTARSQAFCNFTIAGRQPFMVTDATKDDRLSHFDQVVGGSKIRSYLGVPLRSPDGYNIGSLCAIDVEPRSFDALQIAILENLARLVVETLELRLIAGTDHLTGALTRRGMTQQIDHLFSQARESGRAAALVFFDLDHFKSINDRYGHLAGDEVLRVTAQACMAGMRGGDAMGRLGGEEFAVLLPNTTAEQAMRFAERMRQVLARLHITFGEEVIPVTASWGVAPLTDEFETPQQWFAAADTALYQAKRAGRNQCRCSDPTIPQRAAF